MTKAERPSPGVPSSLGSGVSEKLRLARYVSSGSVRAMNVYAAFRRALFLAAVLLAGFPAVFLLALFLAVFFGADFFAVVALLLRVFLAAAPLPPDSSRKPKL